MKKPQNEEAESEFTRMPPLLERMKATWKKINSSESKIAKLDKSDLKMIREAFIIAARYENLNDRWDRACQLFYNKDDEKKFNRDKALREAVGIMGIVENAMKKGKKTRFHPVKQREIYEYYTWPDWFLHEDENGCYYDENGNNFGEKRAYKIQRIQKMVNKFGFASSRAVEEYLRNTLGLKNIPSFKDHRKNPK